MADATFNFSKLIEYADSLNNDISHSLINMGLANGDKFVSNGVILTGSITLALLTYKLVLIMLDGDLPEIFVEIVKHFLISGIIIAILTNYRAVAEGLVSATTIICDQLAGEDKASGAIKIGIHNMLESVQAQLKVLFDLTYMTDSENADKSWLDFFAGPAAATTKFFVALQTKLWSALLVLLNILLQVAMVAVLEAVWIFGDVLLLIGFSFGPLMLPMYLFPPLKYMADGWGKFTLQAAAYKCVATVVVTAVSAITMKFTNLQVGGNSIIVGSAVNLTQIALTTFTAIIGMWVLLKTQEITHALFSGHGIPSGLGAMDSSGKGAASQLNQAVKAIASKGASAAGTKG